MFEPTRLAGEYLVDAYSQTVPTRPRPVGRATRAVEEPEAVGHPRPKRRQSQ
jgi:hypothetical protein